MLFLPDVVIGIPQIRALNYNINVGKWTYYDIAIVLGLVLNLKYVWSMNVI